MKYTGRATFLTVLWVFVPLAIGCQDHGGASQAASAPQAEPGFKESWDRKSFDHGLWDRVAQRFVSGEGLVDYAGIRGSEAFKEYLYRLSKTDAAGLKDDHERLAFWINAYNVLTIEAVLRTLPEDRAKWPSYSIRSQRVGGQTLWKGLRFTVGGGQYTLDQIEHEVLRKRDGLRDPRIHVVLVCAARGCPPLWNHAYTGAKVKEQLAAALRRFVGNPKHCRIDRAQERIHISKIFDWYAKDFTDPRFSPHAKSVPAFLAEAVEDAKLSAALRSRGWRIDYFDYDWKLNLRP
ncbi:MAG: DUF547 domain-containing protein [Phycisphaerae bacterium]